MKLYVVDGSQNVRKVVAVVHHLGLPVEMVQLNFAAGDLHRPEYLAVNPKAMVLALEGGDLKLWESNAIMQYLASQQPSEIFPQDPRARADISRWQFWETNHLNRALSSLVFERFFKQMFKMGASDENAVQKAIKDFDRFAPVLESQACLQQLCRRPTPHVGGLFDCWALHLCAARRPAAEAVSANTRVVREARTVAGVASFCPQDGRQCLIVDIALEARVLKGEPRSRSIRDR